MAGKGKEFPLSIVVKAVDKATPGLKRINDELEKRFKPFKDLNEQFGKFYKNSGLKEIASGFRGIGNELKSIATSVGAVGAVTAGALYGFKHLVDEFDELGDTAEKVGLAVDALAQLRHAAEVAGSSAEELDTGMASFAKNLGLARAKSGKLYSFLGKVSPVLRKQVLAAKSNEEAFNLMADAMAKVKDPAKRAALAAQTFGGAGVGLAPLLARGSKGIAELRAEHLKYAGSQEEAAQKAGEMKDSLGRLKLATDSVKAALVVGLEPALRDLAERASAFLVGHREEIAEWIRNFGERLPGAISSLVDFFKALKDALAPVFALIRGFVDLVGGGENAVKLLVVAWAGFKALKLVGHLAEVTGGIWKMVAAARAAALAGGGAGGGVLGALGGAAKYAGVIGLGTAAVTYAGVKYNRQFTGAIDKVGLHGVAEAFRGGSGSSTGFDERVADLRKQGLSEERARVVAAKLMRSAYKTTGKKLPDDIRSILAEDKAKRTGAGASPPPRGFIGPMPDGGAPRADKAQVTIDIKGAPAGTRVTTDPKSTADVETNVGYQMGYLP